MIPGLHGYKLSETDNYKSQSQRRLSKLSLCEELKQITQKSKTENATIKYAKARGIVTTMIDECRINAQKGNHSLEFQIKKEDRDVLREIENILKNDPYYLDVMTVNERKPDGDCTITVSWV